MFEVVESSTDFTNDLDHAVRLLIDQDIPAFGIISLNALEPRGDNDFFEVHHRRIDTFGESILRVCCVPGTQVTVPESLDIRSIHHIAGPTEWHIDQLNDREAIHPNQKSVVELRLHTSMGRTRFRAINSDRTRFDDQDYPLFKGCKITPDLRARGYEDRRYNLDKRGGIGIPQLLSEHEVATFQQQPGYSVVFRRMVSNSFCTAHEVIRDEDVTDLVGVSDFTITRQMFANTALEQTR